MSSTFTWRSFTRPDVCSVVTLTGFGVSSTVTTCRISPTAKTQIHLSSLPYLELQPGFDLRGNAVLLAATLYEPIGTDAMAYRPAVSAATERSLPVSLFGRTNLHARQRRA